MISALRPLPDMIITSSQNRASITLRILPGATSPRLGGLSTGTSLGKSFVLSQIDGTIFGRTICRNVNTAGRRQPEASAPPTSRV